MKMIDRATYKKIKAMNRDEMQDFLEKLAEELCDVAPKGTVVLDTEKLRKDISAIKGIGQSRLDEIMMIIEKHLEK